MEAVNKQDIIKGDPFGEIQKEIADALNQLDKFDQGLRETSKSFEGLSKNSRKTVQDIDAITKAEIESEKLLKQKIITQQTETKLLIEQEKLKQASLRTSKAENSTKEKTLSLYQQESKQLNDLRNAYKNLALQNKENSLEAKNLLAQITPLDAKLKKIDQTVGQSQRNVGNYTESIKKAIEALKLEKTQVVNNITNITNQSKAYHKTSVEYKMFHAELTKNNTRLTQINNQLNNTTSTINNNGEAVDRLKGKFGSLIGLAGQFGLALGGVAIIKNAFDVIKNFDQGIANLASVIGKSRVEIVALENDAKRLGATTSFTATQVAQLQTELAKLGFTEQQILDSTEAVLQLSAATGTDLARSAEVAGSTLRAFGLDASEMQRVVDVMAKSFSTSALDTEKFAESMKIVAPISKAAGVSIEETTAMLGALANAGISGSSAGTAMRQILSEMDKTGKSTSEALADLSKKGLNLADAEDEVGKNAKSALLVLMDQQDTIKNLTEEYKNADGSAKEMAYTQLNTLGGAIELLKSAWEGFILSMNDASGASSGLTSAVKFLAENLSTIIKVVFKLGVAFLAYKGIMKGINLAEQYKNWRNISKGINDSSEALKDGAIKAKGFGNALKGIGFGLAITAAIELMTAFYDIASGAEAARDAAARLDKQLAKSSKDAAARVSERANNASLQIAELERQRKENKITEKEFLAQKKAITEATKEEVKADIQKVNARKQGFKDQLAELQALQKKYEKTGDAEVFVKLTRKADKVGKQLKITGDKAYGFLESNASASEVVAQLTANIEGSNTRLEEYYAELLAVGEVTKDLNSELIVEDDNLKKTGKSTNDKSKATGEHAKKMKDANDQIERANSLIKETESLTDEIALYEVGEDINAAINSQLEGIEKSGRYSLDVLDLLIERQFELQKAILNRQLMESLDAATNEQEVINAQMRYDFELGKLETKREKDKKEHYKTLELAQEDWVEKNKDSEEKVIDESKDRNKELLNVFEEFQKGLTDILTEQIDARIDQLKKEEDAAKSQQDYLQELAANGNIIAKQSITDTIAFQRESQAEQARLERAKQQIQLISSGLSTFNKEINDGKKPGEALISTGFVMQTLIGLLKNVQFFAKGTDNAPEGLAVVDEKGAEIITDKKGRIKEIGTGKGARFTHLSKGDKVLTASKTANVLSQFGNIQNGQTMDKRIDTAGNSYDLMMLNKLGGIEQAIKNSGSNVHTEWGGIFNGVGEIVERKIKNGNIVTNRYRMKS